MRRARTSFIAGFLAAFALTVGLGFAAPAFAQQAAESPIGNGMASFAEAAGFSTASTLPVIIARLIRTGISFLGIVAVCFVVYGGFLYMTAGGDENRVKLAKRLFRNAGIGLVIVVLSFTIVQFVVSRLEIATGAGSSITSVGGSGGCTGGNCYGDGHVNVSRTFAMQEWNQACASTLQNFQLQMSFTQTLAATAGGGMGIHVKDAYGAAVPGLFKASGKVLTFTPSVACPGANPGPGAEKCFSPNAQYTVSFDEAGFKSATGLRLSCGGGFSSCSFTFQTGNAVDAARPTAVSMVLPDATGASATAGSIVPLQVRVLDDVGASLVQFYAKDANAPVYVAGLSSSTRGVIAADNTFSTDAEQWDTAGYAAGSYDVWAAGSDCAGHTLTSAKNKVALVSASCANGKQDGDETAVDAGGSCGAGAGSACSGTVACAPGLACKNGVCASTPRVDRVTPGDGAIGNLITISGQGFGTNPGTVLFLGEATATDDVAVGASAVCTAGWSDTQLIVQVPANAKSGPVEVRTAAYATDKTKADRTNDAFGARISDFLVNTVVRPGLCKASPATAAGPVTVGVEGINFGATRGENGTVYFGDFTAAAYGTWAPTVANVTSPRLDTRDYAIQLFTGGLVCKGGAKEGTTCAIDTDCGDGSACISNRQGSNTIKFESRPPEETEAPAIASIDTGWKACNGGGPAFNSLHCVSDAECGTGTCVATPTWGPAGQYLTISGAHFGDTPGIVRFRDASTGKIVPGDFQFPVACGNQFWSDSSAVVKIPAKFSDESVVDRSVGGGSGKLSLIVVRGTVESAPVDVQIVNGLPGPGICRIDPVAVPPNTSAKKYTVTLYGENFGRGTEQALFTPAKIGALSLAPTSGQVTIAVPDDAKTGPVRYERITPDHFLSNAVNVAIGSCKAGTLTCGVGTECCANGSCSASCGPTPGTGLYAYRFSTGPIPLAPRVLVACDPSGGSHTDSAGNAKAIISPSPWKGWSTAATICPTAPVTAQFDREMDASSFLAANADKVKVQTCTNAECASVGPALPGSFGAITPDSFEWNPAAPFALNTTYKVTLAKEGFKSKSALNTDQVQLGLVPLAADFSWTFTTAANTSSCKVGSVLLLPNPFTATAIDQVVDYRAKPVSAADSCVILACEPSYAVDWDNTPGSNEVNLSGPTNPSLGQCDNHATVRSQITLTADHSTLIKATLKDGPATTVVDTAKLIVELAKPKVTEQWPSCDGACVNAEIGAKFNVVMESAGFTTSNVRLYRCDNALCENRTGVVDLTGKIDYSASDAAPKLRVNPAALAPDAYYQVVLSGLLAAKSGGAELRDSYAGQDYSWIFRTQRDGAACGIARVLVEPAEATASYVGQRQSFSASPVGAPDACNAAGQKLNPASYTWANWTGVDVPKLQTLTNLVVTMLSSQGIAGAIAIHPQVSRLSEACSAECVLTGSLIQQGQALCGDGVVSPGEDCDTAIAADVATCGPTCLRTATTPTCSDTITKNCCGNKIKEGTEQCDGSSGCTNVCLNAGGGSTCGTRTVESGESCDTEDKGQLGSSCSARCLNNGSVAKPAGLIVCTAKSTPTNVSACVAVCGDSIKEKGEQCDDGNAESADGCSSRCLFEGTSAPTCGNAVLNAGEACDPGLAPWKGNAGSCSSRCLLNGSSYQYAQPSYCGDGVIGAGEECDAASAGSVGPFGVAQIAITAPAQINATTKKISAEIGAQAAAKKGTALFTLTCSCSDDLSCGTGGTLSCGNANCCYARPAIEENMVGAVRPADNTVGACRNTLVQVAFTKKMDAASFANQAIALRLMGLPDDAAKPDGAFHVPTETECTKQGGTSGKTSCVLNDVKFELNASGTVVSVLPPVALTAGGNYLLSVTGDDALTDPKTGVLSADGASLDARKTCVAGTTKTADGFPCNVISVTHFRVGTDICKIDVVRVIDNGKVDVVAPEDPSPGLFTRTNETHDVIALALAKQGTEAIRAVPNAYDWQWTWHTSIIAGPATEGTNIVEAEVSATAGTRVKAGKNNGEETVIATADIKTPPPEATEADPKGELLVAALLCQNPAQIAQVNRDGSVSAFAQPYVNPTMNFSFYYCRDFGDASTVADDLPAVRVVEKAAPAFNATILQENLIQLTYADSHVDALGVRVVGNPGYQTPLAWYTDPARGFKGSPTSTEVDGYQAVRDGSTWYVFAPNQSGATLFPNIYILSYNADARPASKEAFKRMLDTWSFNANRSRDAVTGALGPLVITDHNLCQLPTGNYVENVSTKQFVSCGWDGNCVDLCVKSTCSISGAKCGSDAECVSGAVCDAQKAKLRRDTKRLGDLVGIQGALTKFGAAARHCSGVKTQRCASDAQCGTGETCVADVPALEAGSFIRAQAVSTWPSWISALGNAIGSALPQDPINAFYRCQASGYDAATCFNGTDSTFFCPTNSHVYGFRSSGGERYTLYGQLEYAAAAWRNALPSNSIASFVVENAKSGSLGGFVTGTQFCGGTKTGTSAVCGDGVKSNTEACEIGELRRATGSCTTSGVPCSTQADCGTSDTCTPVCQSGSYQATCVNTNNVCQWNIPAVSACTAFSCGNGIKETGEGCDSGTRNGTYGDRCSTDCKISGGPMDTANGATSFCGDGYVSNGEQCDCGSLDNFSALLPGSWSKSHSCTLANGAYGSSCSISCRIPGPSCGDGQRQSNEACEKGETQINPNASACNPSTSRVCEKGTASGMPCLVDANCPGGTCSVQTYTLGQKRTCNDPGTTNQCQYPSAYGPCVALSLPSCGNGGTPEGTEQCDDGNRTNTDACTNECKTNTCGDGIVNTGVEACDVGLGGRHDCNAPYGGTCGYCDLSCRLVTKGGDFCGDGKITGSEQCDGSHVAWSCVSTVYGILQRSGSCKENGQSATECNKGAHTGETCRLTGLCNGGTQNGAICAAAAACPGGECVMPQCSADCQTSCPYAFQTLPIKITPAIPNATSVDGVDLYSSDTNTTPYGGLLQIPGCLVASGLMADVDDSKVVYPAVDIVFLTDLSGSMNFSVAGNPNNIPAGEKSRIEYVKDSTKKAITDLFASYTAGPLRIGLTSFTTSGSPVSFSAVCVNSSSAACPSSYSPSNAAGPACPEDKCPATFKTQMLDIVSKYSADGGTPTLDGMNKALEVLNSGTPAANHVTFIVLLTDGQPTPLSDVQGVRQLIKAHPDTHFFSATIATTSDLRGYGAHMSSDVCGVDTLNPIPSVNGSNAWGQTSDCTPKDGVQHAYTAGNAQDIDTMYTAIAQNIRLLVGANVAYGIQSGTGGVTYSSGAVTAGAGSTLKFPEGFTCAPTASTVPFSVQFGGTGTINFSNFKLTYCPSR